MSQPDTPTPAETPPSPSLAERIAALVPDHTHLNGGLFSDRTWHWTTPAGVWLVTLKQPMFGCWSITLDGNGRLAKLPPTEAGIQALRATLVAHGAIGGGEL